MTADAESLSTIWTKRFGFTEGLLRGTALSSNILCTAILAAFSGFGTSGVLISSFLHLLIAGILEIPTGIIGDRLGWGRTLFFALSVKLLVTLTFFLAAFASISAGWTHWIWIFIAVESLFDAIANSLMSGSFESAYLRIHSLSSKNLPVEKRKALLMEAHRYGMQFRIGIPLFFALGLGVAAWRDLEHSLSKPNEVLWICLILLLCLRLAVLSKVFFDFKKSSQEFGVNTFENHSEVGQAPKQNVILKDQLVQIVKTARAHFWAFLSLGFANLFFFMSMMFLPGSAMKSFAKIFPTFSQSWAASIGFGLFVGITNSLLAWKILPKFSHSAGIQFIVSKTPRMVLVVSIVTGVLLYFLPDGGSASVLLMGVYIPAMLFASAALQRALITQALPKLDSKIHATWISLGSALGYLLYGVFSGVLIVLGSTDSKPVAFIFAAALSLFLATQGLRLFGGTREDGGRLRFRSIILTFILTLIGISALFSMVATTALTRYLEKKNVLEHRMAEAEFIASVLTTSLAENELGSFPKKIEELAENLPYVSCLQVNFESGRRFRGCAQSARKMGLLDQIAEKNGSSNVSQFKINMPVLPAGHGGEHALLKVEFLTSHVHSTLSFKWGLAAMAAGFFVIGAFAWLWFLFFGRRLDLELKRLFRNVQDDNHEALMPKDYFVVEFSELNQKLKELKKIATEVDLEKARGEVARQVAHDIRSPLAALGYIASNCSMLADEDKFLLRGSIDRINGITRDLLSKKISSETPLTKFSAIESSPVTLDVVQVSLSSVINEKRFHLCALNSPISILGPVENENKGSLFVKPVVAKIDRSELRRILSNLFNNSIEAFGRVEKPSRAKEFIRVEVSEKSYPSGRELVVKILDNGPGIPKTMLPTLGQRPQSKGEFLRLDGSGSGLGLYHASRALLAAGGRLEILSDVGVGTEITLTVPVLEAQPDWLMGDPLLWAQEKAKDSWVVIDDNPEVLKYWKIYLLKRGLNPRIFYFENESHFDSWILNEKPDLTQFVFFVDFEFRGRELNGLQIIDRWNLGSNATLVTSSVDEIHVRSECVARNIKMFPKQILELLSQQIDGFGLVSEKKSLLGRKQLN